MTKENEKRVREEMKILKEPVLKEPGLIEALIKAEQKNVDVLKVILDGIEAKERGEDPIEFTKKMGWEHYQLKG